MSVEAISDLRPGPAESSGRRLVLRDVFVVLLATAFAALVSLRFNLNEAFFQWTRRFEHVQFDELPLVLLVLASGFLWYALRRYKEAGAMIERQRIMDANLTALLAENRRLARQNVEAQEKERQSIARELHDEMGQYLNAIKIDAIAIRDAHEHEAAEIRTSAIGIARNTDHVYSVVSDLIRKLRPIGLDELGLVAAIENCVEHWRRRLPNTGIDLSVSGDFSAVSEAGNLTIFRVVQEALTNIAKHSTATRVTVELRTVPSPLGLELALRITDDGAGGEVQVGSGFGLINMRERIEMLGGKLQIETRSGDGFAINASFIEGKDTK